MGAIWRTIRGYILWSYERGSLHYDIMVTLILLFIFVSPHFLNYKDKPVERIPHLTGVVVIPGKRATDLSDPVFGGGHGRGWRRAAAARENHRTDFRRGQHHQCRNGQGRFGAHAEL